MSDEQKKNELDEQKQQASQPAVEPTQQVHMSDSQDAVDPVAGDNSAFDTADVSSSQIPAVAESAKKNMAIIFIALGVLVLVIMLFSGDDEPEVRKPQGTEPTGVGTVAPEIALPSSVEPAARSQASNAAPVTEAPPPPPPPPPQPPVPTVQAPALPTSANSDDTKTQGSFLQRLLEKKRNQEAADGSSPSGPPRLPGSSVVTDVAATQEEVAKRQRWKSKMLMGGGGQSFGPQADIYNQGTAKESDFKPADSSAPNVRVTKVSNLATTILQGKVLEAVLETAISSDLPGQLRAVVSRDVFAEAGRAVLIPKGSRLIGSYNATIKRGQARIYIVWDRIIRPDGIDIALDSPAIDLLGRSGIGGNLDNKYLEIFSNALLLSTVTIAFAAATEGATGGGNITQGTDGSGDTTTSGSALDLATVDAVDDFGSTISGVVDELIDVQPTISVDQGTSLKVFVNRDVHFPKRFAKDYVAVK